ncbi:hypothetical protein G5V59_15680 [Nocardioides sp. W3-2-3]|uniref:DUF7933 domain-containing protein n=1 Tax=Nocardioides convexus TaxID=2712224 RepID=UPI0024186758|nr:hypothetical protein [Nocardioides convexus]NHA00874.1 hypothetical protein [Nocardioides convexus]
MSFDLPQIVDVTPSLDKAFSPTTVTSCPAGAATCPPSSVSTLTFTVTNTTDLQAKPDWTFTDNLPAGVRVAPTPNVGGTCTSTTGAALVRTAAPGSTSISVTGGDLALGQASCTVTVDVVSATPGTYTNDATNVTTNLVPPDPACADGRRPEHDPGPEGPPGRPPRRERPVHRERHRRRDRHRQHGNDGRYRHRSPGHRRGDGRPGPWRARHDVHGERDGCRGRPG